ncbi:MAG: hypothetical protein PQJ61_11070 [Spirochaetales bacterium]|uniref:Uncharacterized protein n=1 Tax=Candidatus Thalassospirochaeta sargassi TaxID=3119039 RepID=A0AAJ1IHR3_9SPIO|nr:hypothetical protein [Spirochaetales bacterium]
MDVLTILQRIIEVFGTEKAGIVITSISHFMLLIALVYTVIHLIKMMFEHEEKGTGFEEPVIEAEKLIS